MKLHLIPVNAVVPLRPSLRHLDSNSKESEKRELVPFTYHSVSSEMTSGYLRNIMARREGSQIHFFMSSRDYLYSMCPGSSSDSDSFSSKAPQLSFKKK
ncbi:hypothetical protein ACS0TY_027018 [Phlomoides rotata]